jgi:hypothetical protein
LVQSAEAAAERLRECKVRSMSFNIFACVSRCAGVPLSANLRVSLQAGLVYALLRCVCLTSINDASRTKSSQ